MPSGTITSTAVVGGVSMKSTTTRTASGQIGQEVTLPVATALATFLQAGTGTLTAGHGLATGTYDLYWADGIRYGVSVTIETNAITAMTGGAGDSLPANATAVNISEQIPIDVDFDGDLLEMLIATSTKRSHAHFTEDDDTTIDAVELLANEPFTFVADSGMTNTLTGDPVGLIQLSNGTTTAAATFKLGILYDSES